MITLHYVLYPDGAPEPTAAQIASGMTWEYAVAAGDAVPHAFAGEQAFPALEELPRAAYRVAFVAYDDVEDEFSNVAISEARIVPRLIIHSIAGPAGQWIVYPSEGDQPLTELGWAVEIAEFASPAPILGTAEMDIVDGDFELTCDEVLMNDALGDYFLLLLRKGEFRNVLAGEKSVESEPWL